MSVVYYKETLAKVYVARVSLLLREAMDVYGFSTENVLA
ncbi:hypothetical protein SSUA7_1490 [Streptococcus suis A7]|uniref:Uncharacterized protein n=1 Tax=Streptococcus suis (strain GZ1) TaxID=423211 RepID=D5AJD0_STRGZ|nr:hypothetical protein SSU05_1658 [Streptococcus suis 05ZYH33]ABP92826.1 hypothetical protein SSU98_1668 [Streptococcus suis 98HAH33]ADE31945.1 hypothetical protein SSGZ1_1489 [Streptococcus suis GZ1]ADV70688.1 hypothetical protein SSUJS14_1628 [Streptococcus suis JS14]AER44809.1 hypothetical protein SSUA7_1490 [Streptococcus suis A7]